MKDDKIKKVISYQTTDYKEFDTKAKALEHQKELDRKANLTQNTIRCQLNKLWN